MFKYTITAKIWNESQKRWTYPTSEVHAPSATYAMKIFLQGCKGYVESMSVSKPGWGMNKQDFPR